MSHAVATVPRHFKEFWIQNSAVARRLLADEFAFSGPAASISGAGAYMRVTEHARAGVTGVQLQRLFADSDDVCVPYDLLLEGPVGRTTVAEWYRMDGRRIASLKTLLDTAPFRRLRPSDSPAETAINSVCHVTVAKDDSTAVARAHRGMTHYFCSPGCALTATRIRSDTQPLGCRARPAYSVLLPAGQGRTPRRPTVHRSVRHSRRAR